jgi:hypothetical protein
MALEVIKGDLLNIREGILCHQVNCRGKMGSGIAAQIRDKWPQVYEAFLQDYQDFGRWTTSDMLLGTVQVVQVDSSLHVANIYGQINYGYDGARYTNYGGVASAFSRLLHQTQGLPVYVPHRMGCGLAGGDWEVYSEIIEGFFPGATVVKHDSV